MRMPLLPARIYRRPHTLLLALLSFCLVCLTLARVATVLSLSVDVRGWRLGKVAYVLNHVWVNGSLAALCAPASLSTLPGGGSARCTQFLALPSASLLWDVLSKEATPEWHRALAANAGTLLSAAAGTFSAALPPCAVIVPGTTVVAHLDSRNLFHLVARNFFWLHRFSVSHGGRAALTAAAAVALPAAAARRASGDTLGARGALRAAFAAASSIDNVWLQRERSAPPEVYSSPLAATLLAGASRAAAPLQASMLQNGSGPVCFVALAPSFTFEFGVETVTGIIGDKSGGCGRHGFGPGHPRLRGDTAADADMPLFIEHLRGAVGAPPAQPLSALQADDEAACQPWAPNPGEPWPPPPGVDVRISAADLCPPSRPLLLASRRGDPGGREIVNEDELVDALRASGLSVRVETWRDGETSLADQADAVTAACALLGMHGAALTHLLFLSRHEAWLAAPSGNSGRRGGSGGDRRRGSTDGAGGSDLARCSRVVNESAKAEGAPLSVSVRVASSALPANARFILRAPVIEVVGHIQPDEQSTDGLPIFRPVYPNLACAAGIPHALYVAPPGRGQRADALRGTDFRERPAHVDTADLVRLTLRALADASAVEVSNAA